jgi:hypothetical protein
MVLAGSEAVADCWGPEIEYAPVAAARAEVVHVAGTAFGDSCHDTGPPPSGQGVLGAPLTGIEVVIAQGSQELVVAVGSASADYEFAVDVVVPSTLVPGPATLFVRMRSWGRLVADRTNQPLIISEAQPVTTEPGPPASFGTPTPSPPPQQEETAAGGGDRDLAPVRVIVLGAGAIVVAILAAALLHHRRTRSTVE